MNRLLHDLEEMFAEVAMTEMNDFSSFGEELSETADTFECANIDVALAEEGEFTVSACQPLRHTANLAAHA